MEFSLFGRIKSRLARPTLYCHCILLQFIMAKNENVMGGKEESCLKMSNTLFLIVFNHTNSVDQPSSSVSHHPAAPRQKVENDYEFTDAFSHCRKKKTIREQLLQLFCQPSSLETSWGLSKSLTLLLPHFLSYACKRRLTFPFFLPSVLLKVEFAYMTLNFLPVLALSGSWCCRGHKADWH